jgi:hypothetical protein
VPYSRRSIECQNGIAFAILPVIVGAADDADGVGARHRQRTAERVIDETLLDSFPASDPPSWNTGIARPDSIVSAGSREAPYVTSSEAAHRPKSADTTYVAQRTSGERTLRQILASLAGATGVVLLVPFAILLVGLPVALAVRGVLEAIQWLLGVIGA